MGSIAEAVKVPVEVWGNVEVTVLSDVADEEEQGENDEGKKANAIEARFAFTEAVPVIPGVPGIEVRPRVEASWVFLDAGVLGCDGQGNDGEGAKCKVFGLYRSAAEGAGAKMKVVKLRRLTRMRGDTAGDGRGEWTKLEESCSIWCPWGTGWLTKRMADKALKENMVWLESLFAEPTPERSQ